LPYKAIEIPVGQEMYFIRRKTRELERLIDAIVTIFTKQLIASWGPQGEPGDASEIVHVCKVTGITLDALIAWERELRIVFLQNEEFEKVIITFRGCTSHVMAEIKTFLSVLEGIVEQVINSTTDKKIVVEHEMVITLPRDFVLNFETALAEVSS
jgi:hypothetical protein